ncbi:MAG: glycosyltransferase family 2 protein [Bacteroidota bacterium]
MLKSVQFLLELVVLIYIGFNIIYISFYSWGAFFYKKTNFNRKAKKLNSFAVLIPAYKSDAVIIETVNQSLLQNYDKSLYDIIVIADSLSEKTLDTLAQKDITLIPVSFEVSTKAKSLNTALAFLPEKYDYCLILDVDNIMEYDFLKKINLRLQDNEMVIQGHRTAKNLNTSFAILDGLSEEINNHIFRKGHIGLGVSSALIGSGTAIQYAYFKKVMFEIESPVEDKELEMRLLKDRHKIHYENDALVFDEKVDSSMVFANQRRRWLASQFFDFNKIVFEGLVELFLRGNFDYFDKSIQKILLPRVLLFGISAILALTVFTTHIYFGLLFLCLFVLCLVSYILAVPPSYINSNTIKASFRLPQAIGLMFLALFKTKGAATKNFIHTPHKAVHNELDTDVKGDN